jgi:hypothetical protein
MFDGLSRTEVLVSLGVLFSAGRRHYGRGRVLRGLVPFERRHVRCDVASRAQPQPVGSTIGSQATIRLHGMRQARGRSAAGLQLGQHAKPPAAGRHGQQRSCRACGQDIFPG